jgi:hypothetical protein
MFGAPNIPVATRYGIRAAGDTQFVFGSFDSRRKVMWYGNSEFGPGNFSIVIL